MFCHKVPLSEKTTVERNSHARKLRGQKEGLDEKLWAGSELLECQADPVGVEGVTKNSEVNNTDKFVQIEITAKTDGTATTAVSWTK